MKIYTLYSQSHKELFNDWFYPSLKQTNSDLRLIHKMSEQFCSSGNYMEVGWKETMVEKDNYIIQSLNEAKKDEILIHSDVDVQFFKNIKENLKFNIFDEFDILCQADSPNTACFGFMIMKNSDNLKNMFQNIVEIIKQTNNQSVHYVNDQSVMNKIHNHFNIKIKLLDYRYFSNWMTNNLQISKSLYENFNPRDQNNIPSDLILHHANYVIGVQTKIDLMQKVKNYQSQ